MGYINKDLILSGLNLRLIRLKSEHESEEKITELENIIGAIEETETDDVIERSKIDKAIEEMEFHISCNTDQKTGKVNILGQGQIMMLDILKRNIGE